jgi:hypothetical protein
MSRLMIISPSCHAILLLRTGACTRAPSPARSSCSRACGTRTPLCTVSSTVPAGIRSRPVAPKPGGLGGA